MSCLMGGTWWRGNRWGSGKEARQEWTRKTRVSNYFWEVEFWSIAGNKSDGGQGLSGWVKNQHWELVILTHGLLFIRIPDHGQCFKVASSCVNITSKIRKIMGRLQAQDHKKNFTCKKYDLFASLNTVIWVLRIYLMRIMRNNGSNLGPTRNNFLDFYRWYVAMPRRDGSLFR